MTNKYTKAGEPEGVVEPPLKPQGEQVVAGFDRVGHVAGEVRQARLLALAVPLLA